MKRIACSFLGTPRHACCLEFQPPYFGFLSIRLSCPVLSWVGYLSICTAAVLEERKKFKSVEFPEQVALVLYFDAVPPSPSRPFALPSDHYYLFYRCEEAAAAAAEAEGCANCLID